MTTALNSGNVPQWTVADRLRKAREVAGFSQAELSRETGFSRATIGNAEQAVRPPRRSLLIAVSFATGISLDWLENGETPTGPETDGGEVVRHQGIEPRTHWLGVCAC